MIINCILALSLCSAVPEVGHAYSVSNALITKPDLISWLVRPTGDVFPVFDYRLLLLRLEPEGVRGTAEVRVLDGPKASIVGWVSLAQLIPDDTPDLIKARAAANAASPSPPPTFASASPPVSVAPLASVKPAPRKENSWSLEPGVSYKSYARARARRRMAATYNLPDFMPYWGMGMSGYDLFDPGRTVPVHGYFRANGTYVDSYYRRPPFR